MSLESRVRGEALEEALAAYHAQLAHQRRAWIRRVSTPFRMLTDVTVDRRGRHCFRAAFNGPQGCDFVGHTSAGLHVAVEAKSHAGPASWDCGIDPSGRSVDGPGLTAAQWEELVRVEACGGIAVVVLSAWGRAWALTPARIREHVARVGRRTVRFDALAEVDVIGTRLTGVMWWT